MIFRHVLRYQYVAPGPIHRLTLECGHEQLSPGTPRHIRCRHCEEKYLREKKEKTDVSRIDFLRGPKTP